jgi:hypothetical protein
MTKLFNRAAYAFRNAFVADQATARFLEKNYVQVALSSRFGGN